VEVEEEKPGNEYKAYDQEPGIEPEPEPEPDIESKYEPDPPV
jgi:hypothetical protein